MTSTIDMAPIFALPIAQRFEVIGAIWDSIADEGGDIEESDELLAELIRRREDANINPDACVPLGCSEGSGRSPVFVGWDEFGPWPEKARHTQHSLFASGLARTACDLRPNLQDLP